MTANGKVAGLVCQNGAVSQAVTTTPGLLTLWQSQGSVFGAKASTLHSRVQATVKGAYFVSASLTFSGKANTAYIVHVYKNGAPTAYSAGVEVTTASEPYNVVVHGGLSLNVGDYAQIYIESDDDTGADITLIHGQFGIWSF